MDEFLDHVFGGDHPADTLQLHEVAAPAAIVYLIGLIAVRLGKGRLLSRASAIDILLGFILGSLLSRAITGTASLSGTLVGTSVLIAIHWVITLTAVKFHTVGQLFKGNHIKLVEEGRIIEANLRDAHISERDLYEAMRLRGGVEELSQVKAAYKERNGDVSIIKRTN